MCVLFISRAYPPTIGGIENQNEALARHLSKVTTCHLIANKYGKHNIRCNCISPGGYGPGIEKAGLKKQFIENYKEMTPLGRFANDEDLKGPIVFLASAASAYITGHNLLVDGGWSSW